MICNVCKGTGFKNSHQLPEEVDCNHIEEVLAFLGACGDDFEDVVVCTCCGDGDDWYGEPGQHYGNDDPIGSSGPYTYNGGLCECH